MENYKFPDEEDVKKVDDNTSEADDFEIEIEDDTPPQDKGRRPSEPEFVEKLEKDELDEYSAEAKKKIDGLTPDQRFFLAWAQVWRGASRPEMAAQMIKTDPHSPGQYRTIGTPVNMDAWYEAFNVKPGDKLYKKPEDRIKIW
jgi:hypothetical protein